MTRTQLIDALATSRGVARRTAEEVVNVVFDAMRDALVEGRRVELRGFGSFKVREYDGYTGRNPRSGARVIVKPKVLPVFKIGKALHARLNKEIRL